MAAVEQHTTISTTDPDEWDRIVALATEVTDPYAITLDHPAMTAHITASLQAAY